MTETIDYMKVYVQNTWTEPDDQELLDYIDLMKHERIMFDPDETTSFDVTLDTMIFADTTVMQRLLPDYTCPDTYDDIYKKHYHRSIRKTYLKNAKVMDKPFFIKPRDNNKSFESIIVTGDDNFRYLEEVEKVKDEDEVYVCDVVKFINEYRLFMAPGKLYGLTESSQYILSGEISDSPPPSEFIESIVEITNNYCVVDVGLLDTGVWSVVEVNPPFALSSYDYPIDKYFKYCVDAFRSIKM